MSHPQSQTNPDQPLLDLRDIETQLRQYEAQERTRLGMPNNPKPWVDPNPQQFTQEQRPLTTILLGGLTQIQDRFMEAGMASLGYRVKALDCPDNAAMQIGKEFGNRGQCNPTYFTVGNLVKYLMDLRDNQGLSAEQISQQYLFVTAGACGPCRFGTYITEYRKALTDAGFNGFRVLSFKTTSGIKQGDQEQGLAMTPWFFFTVIKCVILGDIINLLAYRIRPYEQQAGATDAALAQCRELICQRLRLGKSVIPALWKSRKILAQVKVNRLQPKPKVCIIGEFWAMTTEGDGNYHLQRFLEGEGAECDIQPVTNWILYLLWQVIYDTRRTLGLKTRQQDHKNKTVAAPYRRLYSAKLAYWAVQRIFGTFARIIGLSHYHLSNMSELAQLSQGFYQAELRGGEGHLEVGKLIQAVKHNKAHLVISVKPFGCMPSSGVSDGVQSLIMEKFPDAHFLPVETSGDGAVNAHSRIQMALHKARQKCRAEFDTVLQQQGLEPTSLTSLKDPQFTHALFYPKHQVAGTAANALLNGH